MINPIMGITLSSMSDALFTRTQQRVLGLLYGSPDRSFYGNEIVRLAHSGIGAVQRELGRLESAGLVTTSRIGNQKHYQANRAAPIFGELRRIVTRTFGVADPIREALAPLHAKICVAFIYGSVARGDDTAGSDIDLMLIGDHLSYADVFDALERARNLVQRPINPTILGIDEWNRKLADEGGYIQRVMKQPRILLIGSDDDFPQPGKPGEVAPSQA